MLISGAGTYIQSKKNHVASKFRSPSKRVHFPNSLLQIKFGVGYKILFWYVKRTHVPRKNLKIMQTSKKAIDDKFIITTVIFMKRCTRALSSVTDSLSNEAEHQKRKPNAVIK